MGRAFYRVIYCMRREVRAMYLYMCQRVLYVSGDVIEHTVRRRKEMGDIPSSLRKDE